MHIHAYTYAYTYAYTNTYTYAYTYTYMCVRRGSDCAIIGLLSIRRQTIISTNDDLS